MIKDSNYSNTTKIANIIRKHNDLAGVERSIYVEKDGDKKPVYVTLLISQNLTNFDMDVADVIYTLYKKKVTTITPTKVLRGLSGDPKQVAKIGYTKDRIIECIDKLCKTEIDIECHQQMINRGEPIEYLGGYPFLVATKSAKGDKYEIKRYAENGKVDKKTYYENFFMPLYGYMEILRQVVDFPSVLLNPVNGINNSIENIQIKRYLIRRLEIKRYQIDTKADENLSEKIVYYYPSHNKGGGVAGMFPLLNISKKNFESKDSWKHKRQKTHDKVVVILDQYKELKYIDNYEINKAGRGMLYGVTIEGQIHNPYELKNREK